MGGAAPRGVPLSRSLPRNKPSDREPLRRDGLQEEGLGLEPTVPDCGTLVSAPSCPVGCERNGIVRSRCYEGNRHRGGGSGFCVRTKQSDMAFEVPSRWFSAGKLKIC